jgi:hypothetical protein
MHISRFMAVSVTVLVLGPAAAASADTQPDSGAVSSGRNANGVAGGPHCHIVEVNRGSGHFENISAYPSHTAHVATGVPIGIFRGDGDCDGLP